MKNFKNIIKTKDLHPDIYIKNGDMGNRKPYHLKSVPYEELFTLTEMESQAKLIVETEECEIWKNETFGSGAGMYLIRDHSETPEISLIADSLEAVPEPYKALLPSS